MTDAISLDNEVQLYLAGQQYNDAMSAARWASRKKLVGSLLSGAGKLAYTAFDTLLKATGGVLTIGALACKSISDSKDAKAREAAADARCREKTGLPLVMYNQLVKGYQAAMQQALATGNGAAYDRACANIELLTSGAYAGRGGGAGMIIPDRFGETGEVLTDLGATVDIPATTEEPASLETAVGSSEEVTRAPKIPRRSIFRRMGEWYNDKISAMKAREALRTAGRNRAREEEARRRASANMEAGRVAMIDDDYTTSPPRSPQRTIEDAPPLLRLETIDEGQLDTTTDVPIIIPEDDDKTDDL